MATATRTTKSLSLEKDLLREVERTRGGVSTSERVNALLKTALEIERRRGLAAEAEIFFGSAPDGDAASRKAWGQNQRGGILGGERFACSLWTRNVLAWWFRPMRSIDSPATRVSCLSQRRSTGNSRSGPS